LRKVLAGLLCALVAAAPAVAFAATDDENDINVDVVPQAAAALTVKHDAKFKLKTAQARAKREHREARERKRARVLAKQEAQAAAVPATGGTTAGGSTATPAHLQAIAACESGGNPAAVGGGGAYRGKYQFDYGTWASVGGSGDPAAASEAEQDQRAAMLYAQSGSTPWPNCG
jgi:soluble lytic murein transglycosylase-like protein